MNYIIYNNDCLLELSNMKENSLDSCVTDPPYGLQFMGKKWDYEVPSVEIWKEVYRVLKPGAYLVSFFGSRTYHRGVINIEDAGFEIRDQLMWIYGSGFPKNKKIEGGLGVTLKPAHEPIVLARKPLSEKSVIDNIKVHGTGAMNIDSCRIGDDFLKGQKSGFAKIGTFQTKNGTSGNPSSISKDRNTSYKNDHPTVKPTELMRYLCRLITPKNGIILDPFMGSGSTGKAAILENYSFIGIDLDKKYCDIAKQRIGYVYANKDH